MALETGTYLSDLVITNPVSTDGIGQADDHLRLLKKTLKNSFPSITGAVTATQAELNVLDGITSTTAELNLLDGVTWSPTALNGLTSTVAEINKLNGFTGTAADLNYASALNATGVTSTEFDYLDGVTSNIQTQLNTKAPLASPTFSGSVDAGDALKLGSWTIWDSGGTLYFQYGTDNVFKIDSSGNITAQANVTAYEGV